MRDVNGKCKMKIVELCNKIQLWIFLYQKNYCCLKNA